MGDYQIFSCNSQDFDITKLEETHEYISEINPKIVIHTAAFTDVDACENDTDKAFKVGHLTFHGVKRVRANRQ